MLRWLRTEFGRRLPQVFPAAAARQTETMAERRIKRALFIAGVAIICLVGVLALLVG